MTIKEYPSFNQSNLRHRSPARDDGNRSPARDDGKRVECLRVAMSIYNVILLLVALSGLGVGVWLMLKEFNIREMAALSGVNHIETAICLLIAGGVVVALLALCGCCGTIRKDKCVLGFYATTLTLMFCLLVAACVLAFVSKNHVREEIKVIEKKFNKTLSHEYGVDKRITDTWDSIQQELECCGLAGNVTGKRSWEFFKTNTVWYNKERKKLNGRIPRLVPESCCVDGGDIPLCTGTADKDIEGPPVFEPSDERDETNPHLYTDGCFDKMISLFGEHALEIGLIAVFIPLLLIFGIVISVCLWFKVKKDPDADDADARFTEETKC